MQKYGVWRIPLRVVRHPAPYHNLSQYLDWNLMTFGPVWSGGKKPRNTPGRDFECPVYPEWHVETFDWFDPVQRECPRWRTFQRFHTREEAVAFCERWRAQESRDREMNVISVV